MTAASIRYNNPGAMYPGPSSKRFGSTGFGRIGGNHKIARFNTPMDGAAAQFDLLRRNYSGMGLGSLIKKWSGNNSANQYTNHMAKAMGITPNTVITRDMLRNPEFAVKFAKAKSQWETGGKFPLNDQQWRQAHGMAYGNGVPPPVGPPPGAAPMRQPQPPMQQGGEMKQPNLWGALSSPQVLAGMSMFDSAYRGGGIQQGAQMLAQAQHQQEAIEFRRDQARAAQAAQQQRLGLQRERLKLASQPKPVQRPWWAQGQNGQIDPAMAAYRAAGKPTTTVNVAGSRPEASYDKEVGKQYAKDFIAGQKAAGTAQRDFNNLRVMEKAMEDPNLYSGTGGRAIQSLKKAASTLFGVPVEGVSSGEIVENLTKNIAVGLKENLPGPLSDSDRRFLVEMAPGLNNTPDGNRMIVKLGMLQKQYQIARGKAARDYAKANGGRINSGFYEALGGVEANYARQFSGVINKLKEAGSSPVRPPTAGIPQITSPQMFQQLPSGAKFQAPDGSIRVKP